MNDELQVVAVAVVEAPSAVRRLVHTELQACAFEEPQVIAEKERAQPRFLPYAGPPSSATSDASGAGAGAAAAASTTGAGAGMRSQW